MTTCAVVTVVHGRAGHLRRQHEGLARSETMPDAYVVVAMDDPALAAWHPGRPPTPEHVALPVAGDRRLPLAAARNRGAARARALGADLLIFLDVDCIPAPSLVGRYRAAADDPGTAGHLLCGPVAYLPPPPSGGYDLDRLPALAEPHPARPAPQAGTTVTRRGDHRLFWSLSFAVRTDAWERIGGFDEAYEGYGGEDTDFGQRAAAQAIPITWVGGATAYHQFHPVEDPPVRHLDDILRNGALFHERWGFWPMEGWLAAFERDGLIRRDGDRGWVRCARGGAADAAAG